MSSPHNPSDQKLLEAIAGGTGAGHAEPSMQIIIERHLPAILALARRMVGQDNADDMAQEAMLRLWQKADELEIGEPGLRPWLYRVTSNLCLDQLRKKREITGTQFPEGYSEPDQDRSMNERHLSKTVISAMADLPARQKLALTLFHLEDLNQRETAEIMDLSEDALESLLRRARTGLKNRLEGNWKDLIPEPR